MDLFNVVRRNPLVFPLACVAAVAMMFVSEGSYWHSIHTIDQLGATQSARASLQSLQLALQDTESAGLAYVGSGRADDLQLYRRAAAEAEVTLETIGHYYGSLTEQPEALIAMRTSAVRRLTDLATAVGQRPAADTSPPPGADPGALGLPHGVTMRTLGAELLARETTRVEAGRQDLYHTLMLNRIGTAALSAICLLALYMYLRQSLALKQQQVQQQRLLQAERDRLEGVVRQRTAQLTQLTHHLQTAREDERHRLARNLHDDLGALLTSAKLDAARIKSRLLGGSPEALERLAHLVETLNASIALGRRIVEDLWPSTLSNLGLVPTLEILAREFAERSGIEVHCDLHPVHLGPTAELVVYRLVQESITNITKHAQAHQVWLKLASEDGQVAVAVRDDGAGFDPLHASTSAYGLVGMRFRIEAEGGTLSIESAPGRGTLVQVKLPELPTPAS